MASHVAVKITFSPNQYIKEGRSATNKGVASIIVYDAVGRPQAECPECHKPFCELRSFKHNDSLSVSDYSVSRCPHLDGKYTVYLVVK